MKTQGPGRLKQFLIGVCGLATAYIVLEFTRDFTLESALKEATSTQTDNRHIPTAAPTNNDDYEVVTSRPLFNPERRPESIATAIDDSVPPATNETPALTGDLNLSAVILTDKQKIALLQKANDSKLYHLSVGESLDGWIIESIDPDQVKLQRGSETKVVKIIMKKSTTVSKAAALQQPAPMPGGRMPPPTRLQPPASNPPPGLAPEVEPPREPGNGAGSEGAPKQP